MEIEFLALDELNEITTQGLPLSVLGVARLPLKYGDLELLQIGKSIFLHNDVPEGFWKVNIALALRQIRAAGRQLRRPPLGGPVAGAVGSCRAMPGSGNEARAIGA